MWFSAPFTSTCFLFSSSVFWRSLPDYWNAQNPLRGNEMYNWWPLCFSSLWFSLAAGLEHDWLWYSAGAGLGLLHRAPLRHHTEDHHHPGSPSGVLKSPTKCRLYWCWLQFIDWRYSQSCWSLSPSLMNCCRSNLRSDSPPPPRSTLPKSKYPVYTDSVAGNCGKGWGVSGVSCFR